MDPLYEKRNVIKVKAPVKRNVSYGPNETRFDLPFPDRYGHFFYLSRFWNESWYTPTQFHDFFEICYVCEGEGWFILEGILFPVSKGDIFVTKPGEYHCGGSSSSGKSSFLCYAIGFRFDQISELEQGFFRLGIGRICRDSDGSLRAYFDNMLREIAEDAHYAHIMVQSQMTAMLTQTLRLYEALHESAGEAANRLTPALIKVLNFVHSEINLIGKIERIAAEVNLSRTHLDREFKRQMGVSLGEYVRGIWVERVKRLLQQSNEQITVIAESLQFESLQTFCVFFKRQTGMSPQKYRKLIDNNKRVMEEENEHI